MIKATNEWQNKLISTHINKTVFQLKREKPLHFEFLIMLLFLFCMKKTTIKKKKHSQTKSRIFESGNNLRAFACFCVHYINSSAWKMFFSPAPENFVS